MDIFNIHAEQPFVKPDTVLTVSGLQITNAMLMGVLVTCLLAFCALVIWKKHKLLPRTFQTIVEMFFEAFLNLIETITGDKQKAEKILPLIGTLFLFLGVSNLIGLIPGITSITYNDVPLFRTPTNDFNMTFSIACAMVIIAQGASIRSSGFFGHVGKFIKIKAVVRGFKVGVGAGFLAIVDFLIGLLDIISEFAKIISLSLRLFGNMYAGEVLAAVILGAIPLLLPAPWLAMNILVGALQAMVFGSLTAAYYSLATEESPA